MLVALILIGMATILGPRLIDVVFWIFAQDRWQQAFSGVLSGNMGWAVLGILLLPWTTLAFVLAQPVGNDLLTIIAVVIGILADVATYGGAGYKGREHLRRQRVLGGSARRVQRPVARGAVLRCRPEDRPAPVDARGEAPDRVARPAHAAFAQTGPVFEVPADDRRDGGQVGEGRPPAGVQGHEVDGQAGHDHATA